MTTIEADALAPEATTNSPEPDVAGTTLSYLDPRALAANPANVRRDLGDLTLLVASIRSVGVLEPLIVIPDGDGGHLIVAGHRRNEAAIEADQAQVPCLVRPDLAAAHATAQVVAMLVENEQRLALSPGDLARGYEQLRLGGLSATKIAKAVGQKPGHVKTALAVAGSELASAAIDRYDLTLTQAAVLAEFSTAKMTRSSSSSSPPNATPAPGTTPSPGSARTARRRPPSPPPSSVSLAPASPSSSTPPAARARWDSPTSSTATATRSRPNPTPPAPATPPPSPSTAPTTSPTTASTPPPTATGDAGRERSPLPPWSAAR